VTCGILRKARNESNKHGKKQRVWPTELTHFETYSELQHVSLDVTGRLRRSTLSSSGFAQKDSPRDTIWSQSTFPYSVSVRSYLILSSIYPYVLREFFTYQILWRKFCTLLSSFVSSRMVWTVQQCFVLLLWGFGPFLVHGLPDLLPTSACLSYWRLQSSTWSKSAASIQTAFPLLFLGFPRGFFPLKYPPITFFCELEDHQFLLLVQSTVVSEDHHYSIKMLTFSNITILGFHRATSYNRGPGLTPGQSIWDSWLKMWHCNRFISNCFGFPLCIIPPMPLPTHHPHTHSSIIDPFNVRNWQRRKMK